MSYKVKYSSNLNHTGKNKTILVFLDGTWNDENGVDGDGVTTNIFKLFSAVAGELDTSNIPFVKKHSEHTALYFRGIGNDEDNDTLGTFYGGIFGAGEKRIRDNAYCEILRHYRNGDRIVIIAFSRGAACARLLASKLEKHGIQRRVEVSYKKRNGENFFLKYKSLNEDYVEVDVDFLGLFDTVGAFGIPLNLPGLPFQKLNLFKDLKLSNNVRQAVHCVAIDESREPFIPTLCNKATNVDEVWFAGVHADIGGGYKYAELGKIALDYMVSRLDATLADTPIHYDQAELKKHTEYSLKNDEIRMHYHGDGIKHDPRKIYVAVDNKPSSYKPKIHHTVEQLRKSANISLAESFSSFTTVTPILYEPTNLNALSQPLKLVK